MDYDHILKRPVENLPPAMFGNNFSWTPSFRSESFYANGSGPLMNPPFCGFKDCSRFPNFSPGNYAPSDASRSSRYHPYRPMFSPFKGADKSRRFYTDRGGFYGPKNCFAVQKDHPQNIEMPSKRMNGMYAEKNHYFRSSFGDRRQKYCKFENATPHDGKVPIQKVGPNVEANYDLGVVRNYAPNENIYRNNEYENKLSETIGENYSRGKIIEAENVAATKHFNDTEDKNFVTRDEGLTLKSLTDPLVSRLDNVVEDNTNLIFTNETTNTNENNFQLVDESGLLDFSLMNIPVLENNNGGLQNIKRESFKPIFIGKDENGQDIILLVESDLEVNGVKSEMDLSVGHTNLEMQKQQTNTHESIENTTYMTGTSSDFQFMEHINAVSNELGENQIFSSIDCYAAEEVVATSEDTKNETEEDKNGMNVDENDAENFKHISDKIYDTSDFVSVASTENLAEEERSTTGGFMSQPGTSKDSRNTEDSSIGNKIDKNDAENLKHVSGKIYDFALETSTLSWNSLASTDNIAEEERCTMGGFMPKSGTSKENRNTDVGNKIPLGEKIDFQDEELERCFQFDCNEPLSNAHDAYIAYFMKRVKHENEHLSDNEQFWKMYRTIVHEVGSSVMQTMYNVLPRLIEISNGTKAVPKKQSKSGKNVIRKG